MSATIAVVTGAGRGIGLAIAKALAAQGHRVLITDVDGDAAQRAAETVGRGAWGLAQDVRDVAGHQGIAALAAEQGRIAVWVNNAGVLHAGNSWEQPAEHVVQTLDVNVRGMMAGCMAARACARCSAGMPRRRSTWPRCWTSRPSCSPCGRPTRACTLPCRCSCRGHAGCAVTQPGCARC